MFNGEGGVVLPQMRNSTLPIRISEDGGPYIEVRKGESHYEVHFRKLSENSMEVYAKQISGPLPKGAPMVLYRQQANLSSTLGS